MEPQRFIIVFTRARTGPYPEADASSPHPYILFNIHFNILQNYLIQLLFYYSRK